MPWSPKKIRLLPPTTDIYSVLNFIKTTARQLLVLYIGFRYSIISIGKLHVHMKVAPLYLSKAKPLFDEQHLLVNTMFRVFGCWPSQYPLSWTNYIPSHLQFSDRTSFTLNWQLLSPIYNSLRFLMPSWSVHFGPSWHYEITVVLQLHWNSNVLLDCTHCINSPTMS